MAAIKHIGALLPPSGMECELQWLVLLGQYITWLQLDLDGDYNLSWADGGPSGTGSGPHWGLSLLFSHGGSGVRG